MNQKDGAAAEALSIRWSQLEAAEQAEEEALRYTSSPCYLAEFFAEDFAAGSVPAQAEAPCPTRVQPVSKKQAPPARQD